MPTSDRQNALDNAGFRIFDFGTTADLAALPTHGYLATRWKMLSTGYAGTATKGTTPTTTTIPKWLRGRDALTLNVTTLGSTLRVRQTLEDGQSYGRSMVVLSLAVFGPDGATFLAGVDGKYTPVRTKGATTAVIVDIPITLGDIATLTMPVDVFLNPSMVGTYQIAWAQLRLGALDGGAGGYVLPSIQDDLLRCTRYARPIGASLVARATSATRLIAPLWLPNPMVKLPTFRNPAASVSAVTASSGAAVTAATATMTFASGTASGGRVVIDGFTGLTIGDTYLVSTTQLGVLDADY